jgi:amino acid adenylation domain-containing protein
MAAKAFDILYAAKRSGIEFQLNDDQLQLKLPKDKDVDKGLLEAIRDNKKSIIDFLSNHRRVVRSSDEIVRYNKDEISRVPLSFSQERLWFIDQLEGSVQYHTPEVMRLRGQLNKDALRAALETILERHEILRTVILDDEGEPYQCVKDKDEWELRVVDGRDYQGNAERLQDYISELIRRPFDLSKDYMMRADLIQLAAYEHILVITMHHIASDGWSISIFLNELVEVYESYTEKRASKLKPLEIQYSDYSIWQRGHLDEEHLEKRLNYWRRKLEGLSALQLPTDYSRPALQTTKGAVVRFDIDRNLREKLQQLSHQQGCTLFMTLLAAFKVLLHKYSSQSDICVGTPIAGRQQPEVEKLIGFFVNTLALRTEIDAEETFIDLLQKVRATTLEAYEHQEVPFEKVVNAVVKERDMSRSPLFQVMLVFQNSSANSRLKFGEVELIKEDYEHTTAKFELMFGLTETAEGLQAAIEYSTDLYTEATVLRMAGHFKQLLQSVVEQSNQKVGRISILTEAERRQLLEVFNATTVPYSRDKSVVDMFEDQVAKTPEDTAVVFEEARLSYTELNKRANQLAHYLQSKGVKAETLVPICIERSLEMIVGVLGILKAGGAYVPIDPEYPADRINYIIEDTSASIMVSSRQSKAKLEVKEGVDIIEIDGDWRVISEKSADNPKTKGMPDNLVYVIYTSGSTGRPKGVRMPGGGLVNLLSWQQKQFKNKRRKVLQFASLNFDVSFQEIFSTLCYGSSLYLIDADRRIDLNELIKDIRNKEITHLFIPFIVLKNLAEHLLSIKTSCDPVEEIIVAGEQLKLTEDIQTLVREDNVRIINQYGPTEAHVVSSYTIDAASYLPTLPPIGKPIDNCHLYILNDSGELLPIGIAGELYIGGVQVARGYLNKPELTAAKFVGDRFTRNGTGRLYRTGDIARWLPDGNIEYLGRIDEQVKIRGYRIELGEIESFLQECPMVRQGVVLAKQDIRGEKFLVGYVVPEGEFERESLISYLEKKLPKYMIPALWVKMEQLPVTTNGKIDRAALPDVDTDQLLSEKYIAPKTDAEKALSDIWQELLKIEHIGVKDNFFELGGHSMIVLQLVNRVRKLGYEIQAKDLFKYQTIEQQSKFLSTSLKLIDAAREGKYIIPIQSEGNNVPFFAIPEFLLYSKIGNHISKDQPFYAIEPSSFEQVDDVVAHYISEIKKICPTGPYCLAGYCQWGKIAVEMAQTLLEQGEEVPLLVLIEYYSPKARKSRASLSFLKSKFKIVYNRLKSNSSFKTKGKILSKELYYTFYYILKKQFLVSKHVNQKFRTYPGKVVLIQASETYNTKEDSHMGWSEVFTGDVEKFIIKGEHLSIFFEPGASEIAEKLNMVFEKINGQIRHSSDKGQSLKA